MSQMTERRPTKPVAARKALVGRDEPLATILRSVEGRICRQRRLHPRYRRHREVDAAGRLSGRSASQPQRGHARRTQRGADRGRLPGCARPRSRSARLVRPSAAAGRLCQRRSMRWSPSTVTSRTSSDQVRPNSSSGQPGDVTPPRAWPFLPVEPTSDGETTPSAHRGVARHSGLSLWRLKGVTYPKHVSIEVLRTSPDARRSSPHSG